MSDHTQNDTSAAVSRVDWDLPGSLSAFRQVAEDLQAARSLSAKNHTMLLAIVNHMEVTVPDFSLKVLAQDNEARTQDNEARTQDNEALAKDKKALAMEKEAVEQEREALVKEKETVQKEKDTLVQQRATFAKEKASAEMKEQAMARDKEASALEKQTEAADEQAVEDMSPDLEHSLAISIEKWSHTVKDTILAQNCTSVLQADYQAGHFAAFATDLHVRAKDLDEWLGFNINQRRIIFRKFSKDVVVDTPPSPSTYRISDSPSASRRTSTDGDKFSAYDFAPDSPSSYLASPGLFPARIRTLSISARSPSRPRHEASPGGSSARAVMPSRAEAAALGGDSDTDVDVKSEGGTV